MKTNILNLKITPKWEGKSANPNLHVTPMICAWLGTGIIKLPNFGGMKQCKSLVNFMDFTLIVHCLGWFHIMTLWDTPRNWTNWYPKMMPSAISEKPEIEMFHIPRHFFGESIHQIFGGVCPYLRNAHLGDYPWLNPFSWQIRRIWEYELWHRFNLWEAPPPDRYKFSK